MVAIHEFLDSFEKDSRFDFLLLVSMAKLPIFG